MGEAWERTLMAHHSIHESINCTLQGIKSVTSFGHYSLHGRVVFSFMREPNRFGWMVKLFVF